MTCVVAIVENGIVYMAADSVGMDGNWQTVIRKDPKIYRRGEFLFGFTSSFRMGQLLGYKFSPPSQSEEKSVDEYMRNEFIDALRKLFKDEGYTKTDSGQESAGTFLVAYRGRIFRVEGDYQVMETAHNYDAVGCGADIALGAMYANEFVAPRERMRIALSAAEEFSAGVRGPFIFEELI